LRLGSDEDLVCPVWWKELVKLVGSGLKPGMKEWSSFGWWK